MKTMTSLLLATLLGLTACSGEIVLPDDGDHDGDIDDGDDEPQPLCTVEARSYTGLGGQSLEAGRTEAVAGSDRLRMKPFAVLASEYESALGLPVNTGPYRNTFGQPPARWYEETAASANTLYASFSLAFIGCTDFTSTGDAFAAAPTAATAEATCSELARQFWNREATPDEAAACATFAVSETNPEDGPRKQWAYTCAAVLSSAGFLAY